jgi:hypothetical protein
VIVVLIPDYNLGHIYTPRTFRHVDTIENALKAHDEIKNQDSKIITEE